MRTPDSLRKTAPPRNLPVCSCPLPAVYAALFNAIKPKHYTQRRGAENAEDAEENRYTLNGLATDIGPSIRGGLYISRFICYCPTLRPPRSLRLKENHLRLKLLRWV